MRYAQKHKHFFLPSTEKRANEKGGRGEKERRKSWNKISLWHIIMWIRSYTFCSSSFWDFFFPFRLAHQTRAGARTKRKKKTYTRWMTYRLLHNKYNSCTYTCTHTHTTTEEGKRCRATVTASIIKKNKKKKTEQKRRRKNILDQNIHTQKWKEITWVHCFGTRSFLARTCAKKQEDDGRQHWKQF